MFKLETVPETKNPRDITIGAGSETGVKLSSNDDSKGHQFANSIDITRYEKAIYERSLCAILPKFKSSFLLQIRFIRLSNYFYG